MTKSRGNGNARSLGVLCQPGPNLGPLTDCHGTNHRDDSDCRQKRASSRRSVLIDRVRE